MCQCFGYDYNNVYLLLLNFQVGKTGAGYSWSRDGGQEEDWRHSVAPIPAEKIRELIAAEEEGEIEEADNDVGAAARESLAGAGKRRKMTKI